ncbi:hypothetical protein CG98_gp012 [Enterobacter phage PG7]|uniref:Uncharacterized protein n=1 Tax=Enterobacter phage PG7 TaxID=1455074 RepID=W6ASX9_9CAUD|nr:hypothetical protein CG98_gp012 [Enterobacter phage PG7]AHI60915.1 hypothetical protein PG7_012 [Enterobacter phage PG7]
MATEYKLGLTYRLDPELEDSFVELEPYNEDIAALLKFMEAHLLLRPWMERTFLRL